MSLVNIDNIEDNTPATGNSINTRLAKIVSVINGGIDSSNIKPGGLSVGDLGGDIYGKMWPVGSVYINASDNTNPGTLFGFGTWTSLGAGRVLVGVDSTQTEFNAIGKTGGEKTHALTSGENGQHSHGVNDPSHSHGLAGDPVYTSPSGNSRAENGGSGQQFRWSAGGVQNSTTGISIQSSGSGTPHNNLQPYLTVYMWQRTA